jgi:hypothetical protein
MPKELGEGILYVSEEYKIAGHLCACGCGSKVMTPLGPTEWKFTAEGDKPSLWPSIGNWQLPCRSHYVIRRGRIQWAGQWSEEQISAGRQREQINREAYYRSREDAGRGLFGRLMKWLKSWFD